MNKLSKSTIFKKIAFVAFASFSIPNLYATSDKPYTLLKDSVGVENIKGEVYILHKVEQKDTYYKLSRQYNVVVKNIMSTNNSKDLRPGDIVKIPTGRPYQQQEKNPSTVKEVIKSQINAAQQGDFTEYKVGKSETLYAISKRFSISVDDIKKFNNLKNNAVREGQILKIPNTALPEPIEEPKIVVTPIDTTRVENKERDSSYNEISANKYGIREKKERGIAVWMTNLNSEGKSNLALHKTAPIGTILKITNPMTNSVTYAKVVGKFNDNAETENAIVVLSKSAATYIGALDKRFLVEINYGVPLEQ
ncbi:LysM peptidoglycan-binding domain-containing protein [Sphingobacterium sp. SYP-B4668]|uniref:LysM peptidoglycan-binding domain-containing protein n=1 Tax=Sphingobacterium sp. SYP-B4668 TaxID=2996035 RepID=UPI0022DD77B1|nr:LysM peptidoglycan-binding domain-containing protein [Sphingobacterium sp. SYP-B4668]